MVTAKSKRVDLEWSLFEDLKKNLLQEISLLLQLADECNHFDGVTSLAWLALENNFCRPQWVPGGSYRILGSRHPVVEPLLEGHFVANDIAIEPHQCLLLTGPNMAGKSTLMRQVAITSLMGQMLSLIHI